MEFPIKHFSYLVHALQRGKDRMILFDNNCPSDGFALIQATLGSTDLPIVLNDSGRNYTFSGHTYKYILEVGLDKPTRGYILCMSARLFKRVQNLFKDRIIPRSTLAK